MKKFPGPIRVPLRERLRTPKAAESDTDRAHWQLYKIVSEHGPGATTSSWLYDFTLALVTRLHSMRISPATLLTPEGFDAVTAVAIALATEDWREIAVATSRSRTLPKTWQLALSAVGGRSGNDSRRTYGSSSASFSNNIRIGRQ